MTNENNIYLKIFSKQGKFKVHVSWFLHDVFFSPDPYAENEGVPQPETPYLHQGLLPIFKEAVMSQLQPVLDSFNLTLERLSKEMQGLQQDMAQLRHEQGQGRLTEPLEVGGEEHSPQESVKAELKESLQKLEEVKAQFHNHCNEVDARLHAQQTILHYNLTNFKTDIDLKLKRNQKMLQVRFFTKLQDPFICAELLY